MIGPVESYQAIYVSACGQDFPSRIQGIEHERICPSCAQVLAKDEDYEPHTKALLIEADYGNG